MTEARIAAGLGLGYLIFAVCWFIFGEKDNPGEAFIGLGYATAAVVVALTAFFVVRLLLSPPRKPAPAADGDAGSDAQIQWEHRLINRQLVLGAFLIAFGAAMAGVFGVILGNKGVGLSIGTAVMGAGAAMLPAGAAASASARINKALDQKNSLKKDGSPAKMSDQAGGSDPEIGGAVTDASDDDQ